MKRLLYEGEVSAGVKYAPIPGEVSGAEVLVVVGPLFLALFA